MNVKQLAKAISEPENLITRKLFNHPDPNDPTGQKMLPVKRAQPKRDKNVSARQWKIQLKAERREINQQ